MDARIDAILKRVEFGMSTYLDAMDVRSYIGLLEARVQDAESKWRAAHTRANSAEQERDQLRALLTGPGRTAYVVFKPEGGGDHET